MSTTITMPEIKNKQRRGEVYKQYKKEKRKLKMEEKKKRKQEEKELGSEAPPKKKPKTIENMRVPDETMVDPANKETQIDLQMDEMASYFNQETTPKILITTSDRPTTRTNSFCKELKKVIPNSFVKYRRGLDLKKIIPQASEKEFTDLIVVNEDRGEPNGLVLCHLPEGPTAEFKLLNMKLTKEIKKVGEMTDHTPEVNIHNFNTRLGVTIGRMLTCLFPRGPNYHGRRVVTFHNQRDYIFFRQHRYQFRNAERVNLQELGPRFILKLRSLQKGTFDSKFGMYEWVHKRHEMDTSRRKFHL
ncbi:ribosome production factor 1 [Aplysia californica]|uniref:Ribosome production factor 1 n=1 Tax=Aplysia californica TaxID=6500 RepID=A0ABM0K1U1_APLCA|nr:ribosome production factor 1 [Aplysia californica]